MRILQQVKNHQGLGHKNKGSMTQPLAINIIFFNSLETLTTDALPKKGVSGFTHLIARHWRLLILSPKTMGHQCYRHIMCHRTSSTRRHRLEQQETKEK